MPVHASPFHQAVTQADRDGIRQLRAEGLRPVALDEDRHSPIDLLDSAQADGFSSRRKWSLLVALLSSRNPTAPPGHVKPEALHGSPWGLEILVSGQLKGGVNDAKGGSQSLEGKVFFSDRTPRHADAQERRPSWR